MSLSARRAWIEILVLCESCIIVGSLSARRAWIEMIKCELFDNCGLVALRKESVDRNIKEIYKMKMQLMSLSARRAWIEMDIIVPQPRNTFRRSPQGERG